MAASHSCHSQFYPPASNEATHQPAHQPYRRTSDVTTSRNIYGDSSIQSSFDGANPNPVFNTPRQSSVDLGDTSALAMLLHPSEQKRYGRRRLPERYSSANTIFVNRTSTPVSPNARRDVLYNGDVQKRRPSLDVNLDQVTNTLSSNRRRILPVTPSHLVRMDRHGLNKPSTELTNFSSSMNPLPSHRNEYAMFCSMSRDQSDDMAGYREPSPSNCVTKWLTDRQQSQFNADSYNYVNESPRRELGSHLHNDYTWDSSSDEIPSRRNMTSSNSCTKIRDDAEFQSRRYNRNVQSRDGKFNSLTRLNDSERTFGNVDIFANVNSSRNHYHLSNEDEIDALFRSDPPRPVGQPDLRFENADRTFDPRKLEGDSFED